MAFSLLEHVRAPARAVQTAQGLIEPLSVRFEWAIVERRLARKPGVAWRPRR